MDASDIRRQNLRTLVTKFRSEGGTMEAFAAKVGTSPAYLSQMLGPTPSRAPGGNFCRKVEVAMQLDRGYLDRDQGGAPFDLLSQEARELLQLWAMLSPPTRAHLKALMTTLTLPSSPGYRAFEQRVSKAPAKSR